MNLWIFSCFNFYNFRRGLSLQECIDKLKSLFGDKAPFHSTVKNWFTEFNCGRRSLKDEVREGPPKTAVVSENIDAMCGLIMQDCHDIPWDRAILGHFSHQHTFDIALTHCRKNYLFSLEMLKKYDGSALKDVYMIVTGNEYGSMRLSSKQNNSPPWRSSKNIDVVRELIMQNRCHPWAFIPPAYIL